MHPGPPRRRNCRICLRRSDVCRGLHSAASLRHVRFSAAGSGLQLGAPGNFPVRAIEKCCFAASSVVSILSVFVIAGFPDQITRLFVTDAASDIIELSNTALKLFALTYVTRWFSFATQSYMSAVEKPVPAMIISVCTAVVFPLLIIAVLWPMGLNGLWLNVPATSLLAAILAFFILNRFEQKEMREAAR